MNGWTPTPRNTERVEYDLQRNEEFIAKSLAFNLTRTFATTEADADYLHELMVICDTDPAHVASASKPAQPRYILSRSWADKHLNSDNDLQYFKGGAVIK